MPEILQMLKAWTKVSMDEPSEDESDYFGHFLEWALFNGIPMPATGEDVACFIVEMLMHGCSQENIEQAAHAIIQEYKRRREFLDLLPIEGAIAMCAAQLEPGRVLN